MTTVHHYKSEFDVGAIVRPRPDTNAALFDSGWRQARVEEVHTYAVPGLDGVTQDVLTLRRLNEDGSPTRVMIYMELPIGWQL
jgi:hypothetical protein